ncbi:histidine--tRNA ligase [Winogradskyella psychrotolerans]|uniref:histidine--tRNA ligase n=1 Tax=Winogradskyella psychrotolerans TaxID=1344585 RepID=UPI001C071931|nr:histidine--tRNA ligase [Winogradskyella psychrotolerans]MBU2920716.1 histidine--tRNA ligase [Winogradskyella psychrotolerans]
MAQKPSIPKGTRDFNAEDVAKRSYIMETIKAQFQIFGFQPIETPSFENSNTLMGKYGDEGDRLIFKILNSGEFLKKISDEDYKSKSEAILTSKISEKALRYDLTVPFARYVVQHQNDIEFPFKRYQIQPVWRADRPQKGRFREFYQCDADVVGSKSLFQEVEFVQLYDAVFSALKLEGVTIKINNRKILSGIAEVIGAQDKLIDFTVALDKLDKIGEEKVKDEMRSKGISEDGITKLQPLFTLKGDFGNQIDSLKSILSSSEIGLKGIEELEFINTAISNLELKTANLQLDVTLARGLNYYTGAIFEVSAPEGVKMGSIGGGGRYDDLTGIFGLKDMSGVGISFGLDRIYLVLEELGLFPSTITESTKVLFINFGDEEALFSLNAVTKLRQANVKAELFPDAAVSGKQMKKQMNYANRRHIPFVVLVGEEEVKAKLFTLKNMDSGAQNKFSFEELLEVLK